MRKEPLRLAAALLALLVAAVPAMAQVKVDPQALAPLAPPATPATPGKTAPKPPAAKPAPSRPAPAATVRTAPASPVSPPVPAAPPSPVALPPPIAVPTRPAPAPTAPPIAADAPGQAIPIPGGLRLSFGPGRADLNPATEASLRDLVRGGGALPPAPANASYTITSFAAGTPEDPSTARRLSLSRATAVRSVLMAQGIASVRIYVRALGPASQGFADGPPDRADVVVGPPVITATAP